MKLSIQMTMVAAAIFASACLGVAIKGFTSLGDIADPIQAADARGFAWFWAFLGGVAIACGALAWWLARAHREDGDA